APGRVEAGAPDHRALRSVRPSWAASATTRSTTSGSELWKTPSSSARAESCARSAEAAGSGSPGMVAATDAYSGAGRRKRGAEGPFEDMLSTLRAGGDEPHYCEGMTIPRQIGPETGPRTALPDYTRSNATVERMVSDLRRGHRQGSARPGTGGTVRALF